MEKTVSFYVDCQLWADSVKVDDFIVTESKLKTNSVYHVAEVKVVEGNNTKRNYVKCYKSDLQTALKRDKEQALIPVTWYPRNKKKKKSPIHKG